MSLMRTNALRLRRSVNRPEAVLACHGSHLPSSRRTFVGETFSAASMWTTDTICSIHQAGLPWYVTIPLVAAGVNFTMRLPLQMYARSLQEQKMELKPFMVLWQAKHRRSTAGMVIGPLEAYRRLKKTQRRLYRDFGCQSWKSFLPLLTMIPFATVSTSLRRIAGANDLESYVPGAQAEAGLLDSSITQGGLAWFTDLSVHDPYFILPVMCSGLLAANVWRDLDFKAVFKGFWKGDSAPLLTDQPGAFFGNAFRRALIFVPLMPLAFAYSPSAMLLYWVTTFGLTNVNRFIIDRSKAKPKVILGESIKPREPLCLHSGIHKNSQTS